MVSFMYDRCVSSIYNAFKELTILCDVMNITILGFHSIECQGNGLVYVMQILRPSSTVFRYLPAKLHIVTPWTCKLSFHHLEILRYEMERIRMEVAKSYSEIVIQYMPGWTESSDKMPPFFKGRETECVGTSHCLMC